MKTIIAGGRDFTHSEYLAQVLQFLSLPITEVVSGGQKSYDDESGICYGADYLGEKWAQQNQIPVTQFPANWKDHGKVAGPMRNEEMADYADFLIAFWDGKSRGTKNMIENMKRRKKPYTVFFY
jgi:hypothetical protein